MLTKLWRVGVPTLDSSTSWVRHGWVPTRVESDKHDKLTWLFDVEYGILSWISNFKATRLTHKSIIDHWFAFYPYSSYCQISKYLSSIESCWVIRLSLLLTSHTFRSDFPLYLAPSFCLLIILYFSFLSFYHKPKSLSHQQYSHKLTAEDHVRIPLETHSKHGLSIFFINVIVCPSNCKAHYV